MLGLMKVFRGVLILGGVATTDVAAFEAEAQVNPAVAHLETFLAAFVAGSDFLDFFQVCAGLAHESPLL